MGVTLLRPDATEISQLLLSLAEAHTGDQGVFTSLVTDTVENQDNTSDWEGDRGVVRI